jgi:hypothetical protein
MIKCIDFVKERCDLDCGNNGHCQSGECICDERWTGPDCSQGFNTFHIDFFLVVIENL